MDASNHFSHLVYEIDMYIYSLEYLSTHKADMNSGDIEKCRAYNMAIDSHAVHLRNLAAFGSAMKSPKKRKDPNSTFVQYVPWSIEQFVQNKSNSYLLRKDLVDVIQEYTSHATCHLFDARLDPNDKNNSFERYKQAFQEIKHVILAWCKAFDTDINPDLKSEWENEEIQRLIVDIKVRLSEMDIPVEGTEETKSPKMPVFISPYYSAPAVPPQQ